jgi:ribosomal protein L20A (L18A)
MRIYRVVIQDLRPGAALRRYTRTFQATSPQDAWEQAYRSLGADAADFHIMSVEPL